jgi:hypothetical protein
MQCLARPQIEAGVMPRTSDGLVYDKSFGEWAVIVGAMGADGKI